MPDDLLPQPLQNFITSLALGLLIGLERERHDFAKAGLRTFALVALLGSVATMLNELSGSTWPLVVGFVAVAAMITAAHAAQPNPQDPGTTSIAALLLAYCLGAMVWYGRVQEAITLAIGTTVLLYFKTELRGIAARLTARDWTSILQFAVLSFVILPVLPNREFGPYQALNPYQVWLMVVLISGVSLAGYAALRIVGARHGAPLLGLFGGMVSSTATTMVFARHARSSASLVPTAVVVVLLANLTMVVRVGVLCLAFAPALWREVTTVVGGGVSLGLAAALYSWRKLDNGNELPMPEVRNPTEIRAAVSFGLVYAAVLFSAAWLSDVAGSRGLYAVALVSGLTDVDAITLSTLRLFGLEKLPAGTAMVAIGLAMLSNLVFKSGLMVAAGGARLARTALPGMAAVGVGIGGALLFVAR